ncbi:MAG: polysaccharide deacetylase family protein [Kiritimatiellae bacterium]|nr:polysaccharide deacetylase family protein [Kiritimatiellia bacterium]MDD5519654.1 polysaccharide deacetylase family protein [Kiritimatiellia bacterium]
MSNADKITVILGIDMETDVGSFTPFLEGFKNGTPLLLEVFERHGVTGTFFFVGDAVRQHPEVLRTVQDHGHEIGAHTLYHETVGTPLFPIPGIQPLLPHEVRPRLEFANKIIKEAAGGVDIVSFRAPRLFGGNQVVQALEELGFIADASLPMYYYTERISPYHPDRNDWAKPGNMKLLEIPCFADLSIESHDEYGRDRDQWPLFRTHSAKDLLGHIDGFTRYVRARGEPVVLTFYFHPWEFWQMPQGPIHYGEGTVIPDPFIVKNCGDYALEQFDKLLEGLHDRDACFKTCRAYAEEFDGK